MLDLAGRAEGAFLSLIGALGLSRAVRRTGSRTLERLMGSRGLMRLFTVVRFCSGTRGLGVPLLAVSSETNIIIRG